MRPAGRGRGKRLLYWFRTPPGVRVGRAPLDETAIHLLEQHNPDIQFDWTRILKAPPPPEGQGRRDARDSRDKDQRGRRESRPSQRPRSWGAPPAPPPSGPWAASQAQPQPQAADQPFADVEPVDVDIDVDLTAFQSLEDAAPAEEFEPAADADSSLVAHRSSVIGLGGNHVPEVPEVPEVDEGDEVDEVDEVRPEDAGSAAGIRLGAEGLVRLRARYAEVMVRIADHSLDETVREELKQRAERLNPDAWVTADEVTDALEQYETVFEGLRGIVGRHPQRRRRGRKQV